MDKFERCKRMREAKARKRMERPHELGVVEIGRVTFEGSAFGGKHEVRLLLPMMVNGGPASLRSLLTAFFVLAFTASTPRCRSSRSSRSAYLFRRPKISYTELSIMVVF